MHDTRGGGGGGDREPPQRSGHQNHTNDNNRPTDRPPTPAIPAFYESLLGHQRANSHRIYASFGPIIFSGRTSWSNSSSVSSSSAMAACLRVVPSLCAFLATLIHDNDFRHERGAAARGRNGHRIRHLYGGEEAEKREERSEPHA